MKSSIRCCISCIFPCGALDVIRIVHSNGRVEEITGTVLASDILKSHPKHVLKEPTSRPLVSDDYYFTSSSSSDYPKISRILIVSPEAELQRGKIYFLIPASSSKKFSSFSPNTVRGAVTVRRKSEQGDHHRRQSRSSSSRGGDSTKAETCSGSSGTHHRDDQPMISSSSISDRYLSEILSENRLPTQRDRRRGRVAVWRPHLESISESDIDSAATSTLSDHRLPHSPPSFMK